MQTQLINISFEILSVSDIVVSLDGKSFPGSTTCTSLDNDPVSNIWLQENHNGVQRLCTTKPFGTLIQCNLNNAGLGAYTSDGTTFETLYPAVAPGAIVLTAHPIHAPK